MAFISGACEGELCFCGKPAEHKVEEAVCFDDPNPGRHPLSAYVCDAHYWKVMGPAVLRQPPKERT